MVKILSEALLFFRASVCSRHPNRTHTSSQPHLLPQPEHTFKLSLHMTPVNPQLVYYDSQWRKFLFNYSVYGVSLIDKFELMLIPPIFKLVYNLCTFSIWYRIPQTLCTKTFLEILFSTPQTQHASLRCAAVQTPKIKWLLWQHIIITKRFY